MNTVIHNINSRNEIHHLRVFMFLSSALIACYVVSPIISFYCSIVFLSFIDVKSIIIRVPLCMLIIVSGATIYSSRVLGFSYGDDFYYVYLPVYDSIKNGGPVFGAYYSSGIEFILPVCFKIITLFDIGLDNNTLLFISIFSISILFYIWLEVFFIKEFTEHRSLIIASAFMFFNFFLTGYMVRQALSTVFILYALSLLGNKRWMLGCLFSLLAIFTHLSAIPILLIFYFYLYGNKISRIIVLGGIAFCSISFTFIKDIVLSSGVLGAATYKFDFYNKDLTSTIDNGYVFHMIFLLALSFLTVKKEHEKYKVLMIYGAISYFLLMPIPLAADRIMMPLTSFMLGGLIFIVSGKYSKILAMLFIPYAVLRFLRIGPLYDGGGTASYYLWHAYPWFGGVFYKY